VPSSPAAQPEIGKGVGARDCVSLQTSVNVQANMIQSDNGQLSLAKRSLRSRIPSERWEQIKVAYVSGIGLREIARKLDIPEGTVLAHAKRNGWTQQIQVATQQQSDAIIPVQSAPQSLVAILSERKGRTRLGLSKYAAEAAERAGGERWRFGLVAQRARCCRSAFNPLARLASARDSECCCTNRTGDAYSAW